MRYDGPGAPSIIYAKAACDDRGLWKSIVNGFAREGGLTRCPALNHFRSYLGCVTFQSSFRHVAIVQCPRFRYKSRIAYLPFGGTESRSSPSHFDGSSSTEYDAISKQPTKVSSVFSPAWLASCSRPCSRKSSENPFSAVCFKWW